MISSFFVPLSVVLANITNLLAQVLIPRYLPPGEYSTFATLWASGQFMTILCYEWMRFAVLRFSSGADLNTNIKTRSILFATYRLVSLALVIIAVTFAFFHSYWPYSIWICAVSLYAMCQGSFEGRQALARSDFDNFTFSLSWVFRSCFSLIFSLIIASITGSGELTLIGLALSFPVALLIFNTKNLSKLLNTAPFDKTRLKFIIHFGIFAAISSSVTASLPAIIRIFATSYLGLINSGGVVLALDISQKALAILGMVVNIVILQKAIKATEFGDTKQQSAQISNQIAIIAAFIIPGSVGFYMLQPTLIQYLIPLSYQENYIKSILWSTVCSGLLAFRLFAIDSIFIIIGKTLPSIIGPLTTIAATFLAIWIFTASDMEVTSIIPIAMATGLTIGIVASVIAINCSAAFSWPYLDLIKIFFCTLIMAIILNLMPSNTGITTTIFCILLAAATYILSALTLNTCNFKSIASKKMSQL